MKRSEKRQLPNVTLAAMTSVKVYETIKALQYSRRGIEFGDVVLITHRRPLTLPPGIRYCHTSRLTSIDDFNYKIVYELGKEIHTEFVLLVHYDGFVVHPQLWRDSFLQYDYIGSPWPLPPEGDTVSYRDREGKLCRVGNSVSLRSRRFLDFPARTGMEWEATDNGDYNEDVYLCCKKRHLFEAAGMKYAPLEEAVYFAREHRLPENAGIEPFAFHKWRGENAGYPRFENPAGKAWKGCKALVRPLLFWRRRARQQEGKRGHGI